MDQTRNAHEIRSMLKSDGQRDRRMPPWRASWTTTSHSTPADSDVDAVVTTPREDGILDSRSRLKSGSGRSAIDDHVAGGLFAADAGRYYARPVDTARVVRGRGHRIREARRSMRRHRGGVPSGVGPISLLPAGLRTVDVPDHGIIRGRGLVKPRDRCVSRALDILDPWASTRLSTGNVGYRRELRNSESQRTMFKMYVRTCLHPSSKTFH